MNQEAEFESEGSAFSQDIVSSANYADRYPLGERTTMSDGPHSIDGGHVISVNVTDGVITSRITRDRPMNPSHQLSPELREKQTQELARIAEWKAARFRAKDH